MCAGSHILHSGPALWPSPLQNGPSGWPVPVCEIGYGSVLATPVTSELDAVHGGYS